MTDAAGGRRSRLPPALTGLALGALFVVARWLTPDPSGHGTHLQLGLLPCTFYALTGVPCPLCGATTSFALMADGRWIDAFANQPFAALLALGCAVVFVLSLVEVALPDGPASRAAAWLVARDAVAAAVFLVLMFAGWTYKIVVSVDFF